MEKGKSVGWQQLPDGFPWFEGEGKFSLPAYSEFMPPPRLGYSPLGERDHFLFSEENKYGWNISELEEELEVKPGIKHIALQIMHNIVKLGKKQTEYHIAGHGGQNLVNNPYWPEELAQHAGTLDHERFVSFLPLALSRTQDDKGRVRWTLFGGSEQGPEKVFWKSFYSSPENELPAEKFSEFISNLLSNVYNEKANSTAKLLSTGFRILPYQTDIQLPSWTGAYLVNDSSPFDKVRYLLTFKPFSLLPDVVKQLYFSGKLVLLPFPGSLVFWGMPTYKKLQKELPLAMQIPLLKLVARNSGHEGMRVPQAGWIHEPHPDLKATDFHKDLVHETYHRTHRWQRIHRHEDELTQQPRLARLIKVLFSTDLETMGLYDKPMAKNCQLWTKEFDLLIDGTRATRKEIIKTEATLSKGGLFGYRFYFPPMQVGIHEIYWHRPVVAYMSNNNDIEILPETPLGYITAYRTDVIDLSQPLELWPNLLKRKPFLGAIQYFNSKHDHFSHQTAFNIINLFDTWQMLGKQPLTSEFARHLIRNNKHHSLEQWIDALAEKCSDEKVLQEIQTEIKKILEPQDSPVLLPDAITYSETATRIFEENWWNDIFYLAHGQFTNKDNADCVADDVTLNQLTHRHRDLEKLGDYLIERHRKAISDAGMEGRAFCGETPFEWRTDFIFDAFGGWRHNQEGSTYERNILVIIPGKNRNEAVVMGDHYDTAYMEDIYDKDRGGSGARLSAAGADDNYSATSTLLQAAPVFLKLAREGKLERDIWLIHLTGEEFPSDCLGARHFCKALIEKNMKLKLDNENSIDLSGTKIAGVFVMDMIGHNRDNDRDIFQISPGKSVQSLKIAHQAHLANLIWNTQTHAWNAGEERKGCSHGLRSADGKQIPVIAKHISLTGEVRTHYDPHSSIYNTDGQIFSDIGAPVVLFMENYDLHRSGYHDTKDTMENIDLDYGSALAAICIETVARVASQPMES